LLTTTTENDVTGLMAAAGEAFTYLGQPGGRSAIIPAGNRCPPQAGP
jgi:hypothetical protein